MKGNAGLQDDAFQSLYHFTVGGPREDARLATRAAYLPVRARTQKGRGRRLSAVAAQAGGRQAWLNALSDEEIAGLLDFDQTQWPEFELEHPELLCFVHRSGEQRIPRDLPHEIITEFSGLAFQGTLNQLSEDHVDGEIISRAVGTR